MTQAERDLVAAELEREAEWRRMEAGIWLASVNRQGQLSRSDELKALAAKLKAGESLL